jgi:hypothetical protein
MNRSQVLRKYILLFSGLATPPQIALQYIPAFDSQTKAKQFAFLGTPKEKRTNVLFSFGVPTGNRTQIEGSTNLRVNRYTIGTIYVYP